MAAIRCMRAAKLNRSSIVCRPMAANRCANSRSVSSLAKALVSAGVSATGTNKSIVLVFDQPGNPPGIRRRHRHLIRHRFQEHIRKPFPQTAEGKHVEGLIKLPEFALKSQQMKPLRFPLPGNQSFERTSLGPIPGDREFHIMSLIQQIRYRLNQTRKILLPRQPPHRSNQ